MTAKWVTLDELPKGSLFVTRDVALAVKSEYHYGNQPNSQWQCVLLESGEYAHFPHGNREEVRKIDVPALLAALAEIVRIRELQDGWSCLYGAIDSAGELLDG